MEILILAAIIIVIVVMWGYYYVNFVRTPSSDHASHRSDTTIPITFPAPPQSFSNQDQGPRSGVLVRSTTHHLEHDGVYYFLQHIRFPQEAKFQGKEGQLLDRLAEDSARMLKSVINWKNTTSFRSLPALNFRIENASGTYTSWRGTNVLVGTDVYAMKMAWRGEIDEPAFQKFIQSFKAP